MKLIEGRDGKWRLEGIHVERKKNLSELSFCNLSATRKEWHKFDPANEIGIFIDDPDIYNVLVNELGLPTYDKSVNILENGEVVDTIVRHVVSFRLYPNSNSQYKPPLVMLRTSKKNQAIGLEQLAIVDSTRLTNIDLKFRPYTNKNSGKRYGAIDEFWGTVDESYVDDEEYYANKYGYHPGEEEPVDEEVPFM